jgi:hypothetical protein
MDILFIVVVIAIVAISDWRYRAKRDGAKNATKAYFFAGSVFIFGNVCYQKFGIQGLLLVPILIVIAIVVLLLRPKSNTKVVTTDFGQ